MTDLDSSVLEEQLAACFGAQGLQNFAADLLINEEDSYVSCIDAAGFAQFSLDGNPSVGSPCNGDPLSASAECCSAVALAAECELPPDSPIDPNCKELFDQVVFDSYECNLPLGGNLFLIAVLGSIALFVLLMITRYSYTPFGALLRKNFILYRQGVKGSIALQLLELLLVGALAFILLYFTGVSDDSIFVDGLGINFVIRGPDENRALIYQNLRPFGGLLFLIVFTYPIASMTVTLVREKETRMKEAMRMAGMKDWALIVTWLLTFSLTYLPLVLGAAFVSKYGAIFPNNSIQEISFLFLGFILSMSALSFLVSVFFSSTRPAAIASIVLAYVLFVVTFQNLSAPLADQRRACLLPPVCMGLGVNTMFDDASLGEGFLRGAIIFSTNRSDLFLPVSECSFWLFFTAVLYTFLAFYLDNVVPQTYGVRRPLDFPLRSLYPFLREGWAKTQQKLEERKARTSGQGPQDETNRFSDAIGFAKPTVVESGISRSTFSGDDFSDRSSEERNNDIESNASTHSGANSQRTLNGNKVMIQDLTKVFTINGMSDKRVAVNKLNLEFSRDQITVLLGPNGAGKSTTFAMLTGLIEPTSGDVSVFGMSIRNDLRKIRSKMGWVPQHDIIYPTLTVKQHLELFAALRSERLDLDSTLEMLKELAILDKLHAQAKSLSGGQKRKLCLAMALTGHTELILCDEVSSGVDPHSRRSMWNLLQNNRRGRVIILTTHFMDEADVLGDKIAIIANGSLCCEGTSLHLKQTYGNGYRLTVGGRNGGMPENVNLVLDTVARSIPDAELVQGKSELEFQLPFEATAKFPKLLRELEHSLKCKIGINVTSLEEVFLNVAEKFAGEATSLRALQDSEPYVEKGPRKKRAFIALIWKRIHYAKRDLRSVLLVLLLPFLFSLALLVLPVIPLQGLIFPGDGTSAPAQSVCESNIPADSLGWETDGNPVDYPSNLLVPLDLTGRTCCPQRGSGDSAVDQAFFAECIETLPQCVDVNEDDALNLMKECQVEYSFCVAMPWLCDVNACCDPRNSKSPWYLCQPFFELDSNRVIEIFGSLDVDRGNFNNFCGIKSIGIAQSYVNSFIRTIVILIGFAFPVASVIAFAVMEKEDHRNTKEQQLVNGVSKFVYWSSAYVFDQVTTLLPVLPLPFILIAMTASELNYSSSATLQIFALVIGFSIASVPMAYALSFRYKMHARALIGAIVINLVTGAAFNTLTYTLEVVPLPIGNIDSQELVKDYLRFILSIFPGFALADGIQRVQTQLVNTCVRNSFDIEILARCTDLLPDDEYGDDLGESVSFFRIEELVEDLQDSEGTIGGLNLRFESDLEDTLISLGYLFGMAVVFWLYVIIRETNFYNTFCCCFTRKDTAAVYQKVNAGIRARQLAASERGAENFPVATEFRGSKRKVENALVSQDSINRMRAYTRSLERIDLGASDMMSRGKADVEAEARRVKSNTSDVVQFLGLHKNYGKKVALDDLWLGIEGGTCFGYLGVNGAGKSTTMTILTGFQSATRGTATVNGKSIKTQLRQVRSMMGYCPQFDALYDKLTVREHLEMYSRIRGLSNIAAAVNMSIRRMQLEKFRDVQTYQLSGGNKRKLSAGIAMLGSPELIVLDEPSSGIDPHAQRFLWDVIRDTVMRTKSAVILVSHSLPEVEACCDKIGILIAGKLRCLGTSTYLKNSYSSGCQIEVTLQEDSGATLAQPVLVSENAGVVTKGMVKDLCEILGNPERTYALEATGKAASSSVAYALNTADIGSVMWEEFAAWWILEDRAERLEAFLRKLLGQDCVDLVDRHGSYLLFSVDSRLPISEMFELFEANSRSYFIKNYSISQTSLDEIFNKWVDEVEGAPVQT